jgi:hypothetical protein
MTQFRKLVSSVLSLSTALTLSGLGLVSQAYASPLTNSFVQLSDSRGSVSSSYTITFNVASTTAIKAMKFFFANKPSGSVVTPPGFDGTGGSLTTVKKNGSSSGSFTGDFSQANGSGTSSITISDAGAGTGALVAGNTMEVVFGSLVNNDAADASGNACDTVANSESCYIRITTYSDSGATTPIDSSVASYTVVSPVTVTATVDPSLTFTVSAMTSGAYQDGNISCANTVTTTATTLPFGNLGVGIAKNRCAQHSLAVATNANGGYDTYMKFLGAAANTNMMTGTISGNNIDPFIDADGLATYVAPETFDVDPNGTSANVNTGWLGFRSNTIGAFSGSNLYAPPTVNTTATPGDKVMTKASPDLGTTATYVTYKIAVNALQPADTYTGTVVYNVVAKY